MTYSLCFFRIGKYFYRQLCSIFCGSGCARDAWVYHVGVFPLLRADAVIGVQTEQCRITSYFVLGLGQQIEVGGLSVEYPVCNGLYGAVLQSLFFPFVMYCTFPLRLHWLRVVNTSAFPLALQMPAPRHTNSSSK